MHIIHIMANNSSAPFLSWFAERIRNHPGMKFSFVALYPEEPQMIEEMKKLGCDAYWIKFDHRYRKSGMVSAIFKLYKLFRKLKPDVVNTHLFDDSLPGLFAARVAGVKIRVIQKCDTAFHWNFKPFWVWADRFNNFNSTHIIAISEESKKFILEKEKARPSKVYVIRSGADLKAIRLQDENAKKILKVKYNLQNRFVIGTIARYIEWKGYRYIIEAAKAVVEKDKNVKFLFIGEGQQKQELVELITEAGLNEFIEVTGWIDRKLIPSVFGIMDIYLHASLMEPFGYVLAEAMANGVPIVTTKTGLAGDMLTHKDTCYFVETKNSKSIVDGVNWMIEHLEERKRMKGKLEKLADEQLGVDRMLADFIKLYKGELTASPNSQ